MSVSKILTFILTMLLLVSCSVTKHVSDGEYLLHDVKIVSHQDDENEKKAKAYLRQQPNAKWFSLFRVPLRIYSLSGKDDKKWINKVLQRIGEAPVKFNADLAEITRQNIEKMLRNDGYLRATVDFEFKHVGDKKMETYYYLHEGKRYKLTSLSLECDDEDISSIMDADTLQSLLVVGDKFSIDLLELERRRITQMLRDKGYYRFQKDYITFTADTARYSTDVNVKMNIAVPAAGRHTAYKVENVYYISDAEQSLDSAILVSYDTVKMGKYALLHKDDVYLKTNTLMNNTYLAPGDTYSQSALDRTYNSFAQLSALKYTTIRMQERTDSALLDMYVMFQHNKRRSISFEVDATNTMGFLGTEAAITYTDKNAFRGSEMLSMRLYGAFDNIISIKDGFKIKDAFDDLYWEYGTELSLRLYGGIFSSLLPSNKQMLKSSTTFSLKFNVLRRPEFKRYLTSGAWRYTWSRSPLSTHTVDVIDINYINVPWMDEEFKAEYIDSISNVNSILKYNYENLLITKLGHTYTYNSTTIDSRDKEPVAFSLRTNVECSGNLLYGINSLFGGSTNEDGQYRVLNIAYAQYAKCDMDFTTYFNIDDRNSLVAHLGVGVAYPYGNSTILPFEKRYFSGGANSVRGWSVRTLGPGSYRSEDNKINFINQTGDLKLDFNLELRTKLVGALYSAVFVDAGNIWTLRNYKEQPGGQFKIDRFYKEIAVSYGIGFRLKLNYFVLRLDCGMKAINPAYSGRDQFPILHPRLSRDFAGHIAIGYPF